MSERLDLPVFEASSRTDRPFQVPTATVRLHTRPELVGELLVLLAELIPLTDATSFRRDLEKAAKSVAWSASTQEYLPAFVDVATEGFEAGLISTQDLQDVVCWSQQADRERPLLAAGDPDDRERWELQRDRLQAWIDSQERSALKRNLRQRSVARVTCGDCNSMLAWLVPQGSDVFLVLARGEERDYEVALAAGEYGGYSQTKCGRRKGGRLWVLHADWLVNWMREGNADTVLRHSDKTL